MVYNRLHVFKAWIWYILHIIHKHSTQIYAWTYTHTAKTSPQSRKCMYLSFSEVSWCLFVIFSSPHSPARFPYPQGRNHWIYFVSLYINLHVLEFYVVDSYNMFFGVTSFTPHNDFDFWFSHVLISSLFLLDRYTLWIDCILFLCSYWWTFALVPFFDCRKRCCYERLCISFCVNICFHFSWVNI